MRKKAKTKIFALLLFTACLLLQLYPLPFHPADSVRDHGDPLLNTWIISWVQENLFTDSLSLFNANIFYPLPNTLSYSEHLLPQAILSLPVSLIFKNPILTYNFIFFFSFIFAAYAMFLLVRHLTRNDMAGMICGIIFAFNNYHLDHLAHLQLLSSGLIPLSLLYLHKFFEDKNIKNSILFALFFTIQALASIYYGLFFISILALIIPLLLLLHRREIKISFLARLALPLFFSALILFVFSIPYLRLFKTFNFKRPLAEGADLTNYLAPSPSNVFLGKILSFMGGSEHYLFPGFVVLFMAGYCLFSRRKVFHNIPRILRILILVFVLPNLLSALLILLSGGYTLNFKLFKITGHNLQRPVFVIFSGLLLYIVLSLIIFILKNKENQQSETRNLLLYPVFLFWALLLSFGSTSTFLGQSFSRYLLPFKWFYDYIPGFKGIREPSRYGIFVIFSLTVMAGYGLKHLLQSINKTKFKILIAACLVLFINLEYLSIRQRITYIPVKNDIPPTYRWLNEQKEDFAIIELPFIGAVGNEPLYMYFSIFHKKKLVNGYSGFIPPSIDYVRKIFSGFPSPSCNDILDSLNVKYVVVHPGFWKKEEVAARKLQRLERMFASKLKLVKEFTYKIKKPNSVLKSPGRDLIYEVITDKEAKIEKKPQDLQEIQPSQWEASSNMNKHLLPLLKDNNLNTRWSTFRSKTKRDFLLIKFSEEVELEMASLFLGNFLEYYALDFLVEASQDGQNWYRIEGVFSPGEFTNNLIHSPLDPVQNLYLKSANLCFLKIIQVGGRTDFSWSVAELKLFQK